MISKMRRYEDIGATESQVLLWLDERGIPLENYRNLSCYDKGLLHEVACTGSHSLSERQRRSLYRTLVLPESRKGGSIDPVDSQTSEELRTFFSALTPRQGSFGVDWGCDGEH